jgi:hypothetical protein
VEAVSRGKGTSVEANTDSQRLPKTSSVGDAVDGVLFYSLNSAHLVQVIGNSTRNMSEEWNVPYHSVETKNQVGYVTLQVKIGTWKALRGSFRAWLYVLANRTFFSEYVIPLVLASLAVIAYGTDGFGLFGETGK